MKLKNGGLFRRGCFKRASGGPVFSALPEKTGEKRGAGYVWCILRVQFRRVLIFGCYEHTYSPYGRYGTRRLLRYTEFARQYRFAAVPSKPPLAASRAVRGGFWLIAGLVPARPWLPGEPSISGSTGKKEETALEDKRLREQRGLVPARPFPTIRRRRSSGTLCRSSDRAAGRQRRSPQSPDSPRSVPHRPSRR